MAKRERVRLKDPGTMFTDPDTGWSIGGRETKALPARPGQAIKARIRHGALILADAPPKKKKKDQADAGDKSTKGKKESPAKGEGK